MNKLRFCSKVWKRVGCTSVLTTALVIGSAIATLAQPQQGKYGGSSANWVPDYVGTIQWQSTGEQTFTAVADVELKQKPTSIYDPNPTVFQYEMRGLITFTSPFVIFQNGKPFLTCTAIKPVPIVIKSAGLTINTNDEQMPKNTYEFYIFRDVPIPDCVDQVGQPAYMQYRTMSVSVNTTDATPGTAVEQPVALTPQEQAAYDKYAEAMQAIANNPALQQELEKIIARDEAEYRRTGKKPTGEAIAAEIDRLRQAGVVPDASQFPTLDPNVQRKLESRKPDYSRLIKFTDINRLKDQMTFDRGSQKLTLTWDLRRVNAR